MFKSLFEGLKAAISLVLVYCLYAIVIFVLTVFLGLPIYFGIEYIKLVNSFFFNS